MMLYREHSAWTGILTAALMMLGLSQAVAEEIRVAVASNFTGAIKPIAHRFQMNSGHKLKLIFGSTGKHYAQIINGAPFDVFLAADSRRPQRLEGEGRALPGSRFTYAVGKLVLWSPVKEYVDPEGQVLQHGQYYHLAIANPKLAPYGRAAQEILQAKGLWDGLRKRIVRGENIAQAYQFVKSGNAELGFVAYAQIKRRGQTPEGSLWMVPQALYTPIEQQAVLLKDNSVARSFLAFMRSHEALQIIHDYGYDKP